MKALILAVASLAVTPALARSIVRLPTTAPSWSPQQATGAPNVSKAGDDPKAWATQAANGGAEWLELTYPNPVKIRMIRIFETLSPGAISKVVGFVGDEELVLWEGTSPAKAAINVFEVKAGESLFSNRVRIYLDTTRVAGWNEIDAVELIGADGSRQWANGAKASSYYGEAGAHGVIPGLYGLHGQKVSIRLGSGQLIGGTLTATTGRFLTLETDGRKTLVRIDAIETINPL